jgi:CheY-like chemotaxis protein
MHNNAGHITIRLGAVMLDAALATERPALEAMHANRPGVTVSLAVSDDGPGMDEATLLRIFEPFFTTKPAGEGTGLGLSVVHGIVQTHDGVIAVESQPGMGSTFTLYLPAVAPTLGGESLEEGVTVTAPAQSPDGAQHILYIDDDEALVFLIKRILERRGYRISGYVDQREALAALRADPAAFDLVVTDYNMPGMSGLDVARQIRMIRADLPVAVASGFIDEALRLHAAGAGVRELIFKANAAEELGEAFTRVAQSIWRNSIPP